MLAAFAALQSLSRTVDFSEFISEISTSLSHTLKSWCHSASTPLGLDGVAGTLACLTSASRFLTIKAFECYRDICIQAICNREPDSNPDLMAGASGEIVGLYSAMKAGVPLPHKALNRVKQNQIAIINACRKIDDTRVWKTVKKRRYNLGLAHGTAGIALALALSNEIIPSHEAVDLSMESFSTLKTLLTSSERKSRRIASILGNWSWCSGLPGVMVAAKFSKARETCVTDTWYQSQMFDESRFMSRMDDTFCCGLGGVVATSGMLNNPELRLRLRERVGDCFLKRVFNQRGVIMHFGSSIGVFQGMLGLALMACKLEDCHKIDSPEGFFAL
jgi:lantibiotic modifying enzyme